MKPALDQTVEGQLSRRLCEFLAEEDLPNGPKVVILSHGLWTRRFGGDRSVIGRPVTLNGESYTVVGIMPAEFRYPATAELWTPVGIDPASREKANYLEISARLKDGVTIEKAQAEFRTSTAGYFETMGLRLAQGRFLNETDGARSEPVALINEAAVRRFWPDGKALGSRITLGKPFVTDLADTQPRRIVGIVKDVREVGLDQDAPPIVYLPIGQMNPQLTTLLVRLLPASLVVRTDRDATGLLASIRREIWAVDPRQPIAGVATMEEIVARSVGNHRFNMVLMSALAFLALVLAGVGIYGVLSYLVTQRTREIGVRMALGATAGQVLALIVRQGLVAAGIGVAVGLGLVIAGTRVLKSLLVGVKATDPLTFLVAAAVLTTVAVIASSIPARRASAIDPLVALRRE